MNDDANDIEFLESAIGPNNTDYYLQKFDRFERGEGPVSWNWPAFFVTLFWLLYRKMWAYAAIYFFLPPVLTVGLIILFMLVLGDTGLWVGWLLALAISWIAVPIFANALYYRVVRKRIERAHAYGSDRQRQLRSLAASGGTSPIALIIVLALVVSVIPTIGILAAIAIPAYQDFTIRTQVSLTLTLSNDAKTAVAETWVRTGAFPGSNAAASLPPAQDLGGQYAEEIAVLSGGQIRVTFGNDAHPGISSNTLFLTPHIRFDDVVVWQCGAYPISQPDLIRSAEAAVQLDGGTVRMRHRPANCRS